MAGGCEPAFPISGLACIVASRIAPRDPNVGACCAQAAFVVKRLTDMANSRKSALEGAVSPFPDLLRGSRKSERLRRRAAWMYYVEDMTQSEIALALAIGRVSVVRLLSEARALGEVRISVSRQAAELAGLEIKLQNAYQIPEVVIAPLSSPGADPTAAIGAATGHYVSELLRPNMKIGLGWGRTLIHSLNSLNERVVQDLSVVSLVGGITRVSRINPAEFAWQFARTYQADCFLVAAPAIVDSVATKEALIERCGLGEVYAFSKSLDAIVVGVGAITPAATINLLGLLKPDEREEVLALGAVGDILCNIFDAQGGLIDHSVNSRVMSVPIDTIAAAPIRVVAAGGAQKIQAIAGAIRLTRPTTLITDEISAAALLELNAAA
jgi:DNA-binding transcriptional regulator LsrR (DeoR family)